MTFNDIFKSSFLESVTEFSVVGTLIGLAFALVIGLYIFMVYKKTLTGVLYSESFALTLVILTLASTAAVPRRWAAADARFRRAAAPVLMLAALALCTAYLVDNSYNPFLYFRF